jgi:ribosome-associated protein
MRAAMPTIPITAGIALDAGEVQESFLRASGPGGQNVNKLETAVRLRFDAARSPSLPEAARARLLRLAGRRITREGVLVITARRHRTQERNRAEALERLVELIRQAAAPPPPARRPTKPTRASQRRRLESKTRRAAVKRLRSGPAEE